MIYVYMVCCISGCCSFKGCQIQGHCEAIFTIQQCFRCSNVVTLRRPHYQNIDSIHESGSMCFNLSCTLGLNIQEHEGVSVIALS
jgi:hypothetical protein